MPFNPVDVGHRLVSVGKSCDEAGKKLKLGAAEVQGVATSLNNNERIDRSLEAIEAGTRSTRDLLQPISAAFHAIANAFNGISIPSIDVDSRTLDLGPLGRHRVVTGVTLSSVRPFRAIGTSIEAVADDIDNIRAGLREIANATRDLKEELPRISTRLANEANNMDSGGDDLILAGAGLMEAGTLLAS